MGKRMSPESWFLLLLIASATSEDAKDACQVAGCACTVFDDVGEMFLQCANRSLLSLPELASGVVGVDASHNMISEVTKFPKLSLEVLDLHFNRISEIPAGVFAELSMLEMLDLSHNNIADVTPECFEGLASLTVLNLTENFLEVLHPKVFSATPLLKKLLLAGNNLKAIDSSWLASLPKLDHLDLRMLGLRSLPKDVFRDLPLLHLIELSQNEFEEVPAKALASAKSLKILHMEQNPIVTLTAESFADIVAIEELHLSAMPILETVEEGAFVGLQHLKILDLANNPKLSYIAVGALSIEPGNNTLKELYLSYANLTSLSFDGYEWCSVDVLDLRGNPWHCDCSLYWVKGCHFAPELTTKFLCSSPATLSGMPVMQLTDDDVRCVQHSAAASGDGEEEHHHGHMTLRLLVVTAGLVTLLMVLAVALVAFRHRDIRDWFQDRKRIGAVYYVKASSGPSSRCSQV